MPMYEYECEACGARFEQIRKFSDPPIEVCQTCGQRKVQKLVSSPAIQFKGSGWYINDYAPKGAAGTDTKEPGSKEPGSKDTASKDTASKDTKSSPSDSSKTASSSGSADKAPATTATKDG